MPLVDNVTEEAARLTEPFSLIELACVDYFGRRLSAIERLLGVGTLNR
ncbi:MAG: hypothetical protein OEW09_05015 [Anaerolineae bacterium]|nr:hypothetical protein [Anaerolineae bacterium]